MSYTTSGWYGINPRLAISVFHLRYKLFWLGQGVEGRGWFGGRKLYRALLKTLKSFFIRIYVVSNIHYHSVYVFSIDFEPCMMNISNSSMIFCINILTE